MSVENKSGTTLPLLDTGTSERSQDFEFLLASSPGSKEQDCYLVS